MAFRRSTASILSAYYHAVSVSKPNSCDRVFGSRGLSIDAIQSKRRRAPTFLRRLWVGSGLAIGLGTATWVAAGEDPASRARLLVSVPLRTGRVLATVTAVAADYRQSLKDLPVGSREREVATHACHERGAERLRDLCFKNGGIYIKLGQHIGQLDYVVPKEYVVAMRRSMLNNCPVSSFEDVKSVVEHELGAPLSKLFSSFERQPVASASLAQVHRAQLNSGETVAVKVQHAHLQQTAAADTTAVRLVLTALHWFFPHLDYRWLIKEVEESLPQELDFTREASNAAKCATNFASSPHKDLRTLVAVPRTFPAVSSHRVLTMEWMDGVPVTSVHELEAMGIRTADVARLISLAFSDMIFRCGFVHCDPHAANLLVRPKAGRTGQPEIVLLDHGLYRSLSDSLRLTYARLWKSLVLADQQGIKEQSVSLGAGDDLYIIFASSLTLKSWDKIVNPSADHLVLEDSVQEKETIQKYAAMYFTDITRLLARLPRIVLLLLKTNDCLRSLDALLGTPINTFAITARECTKAITQAEAQQPSRQWWGLRHLAATWHATVERARVELQLLKLDLALLLSQLMRAVWGR